MRSYNKTQTSGNVGEVNFGQTNNGTPACSFMMAIEAGPNDVIWVRVNVFGGLVKICESKLRKGGMVFVSGELMTRPSKRDDNKILEIRCLDIIFMK